MTNLTMFTNALEFQTKSPSMLKAWWAQMEPRAEGKLSAEDFARLRSIVEQRLTDLQDPMVNRMGG